MSRPIKAPTEEALPSGRLINVPGAGTMFVRQADGPPGAKTVVLLHGWTSSADITWHGAYGALANRFTVIAPDLRGHGQGPRGSQIPHLRDVAADVGALIKHLDTAPAVVAGYSLGAAVAQLVAQERPDLVSGLILCAPATCIPDSFCRRILTQALRLGSIIATSIPADVTASAATAAMRTLYGNDVFQRWVRSIVRQHRWSDVMALGADLAAFDSNFSATGLDVPSAMVITAHDRSVPAHRQHNLAKELGASVVVLDAGHNACLAEPERFSECLLEACHKVAGNTPVSRRRCHRAVS